MSIYPRTFAERFTCESVRTGQDYSALMSGVLTLLYGCSPIVRNEERDMTNDTSK
jgi:hypothetical protein